jgi:hypothetical protein
MKNAMVDVLCFIYELGLGTIRASHSYDRLIVLLFFVVLRGPTGPSRLHRFGRSDWTMLESQDA